MFESFGRGFRMIMASIKMGWQDKRLLLPSILTVLTNIFFGIVLLWQGLEQMKAHGKSAVPNIASLSGGTGHSSPLQAFGQFGGQGAHLGAGHHVPAHMQHWQQGAQHLEGFGSLINMSGINGSLDQSGFAAMGSLVNTESILIVGGLMSIWWLTNRFLEGVTTALVYSHLTEGSKSGRVSEAVAAVFASMPAIIVLGICTFIAKKIAGALRSRKATPMLGFGFNFLAGVVEIFWTLAGHLLLPAIVIEGMSFWGALKRADRIAQGNLLTIGVGEVGVDLICRLTTFLVYAAGLGAFAYCYYAKITSPQLLVGGGFLWAILVVFVTALSMYIRSAFYTCLYVWAIDAEAVQEVERARVRPPEPLAEALA